MKKFIISSDALKQMIQTVSIAVNPKATIPVLTNILCKVTDKKLEIVATDLEITMLHSGHCETEGAPFDFLLPFDMLKQLTSKMGKYPLQFVVEKKGVKINGDNEVYEIKSPGKVSDFPEQISIPVEHSMELTDDLVYWLKVAQATCSKDNFRPAMTNVLLELRKKQVTIASTDGGHSLFSMSINLEAPTDDDVLITPRVIKTVESMSLPNLYWNEKNYAFQGENLTVIITRQDLKFPNFKAIIPPDFDSNLTVSRLELIGALDKCSINTDPFKQTQMSLKVSENKVNLFSSDDMNGIDISVDITGSYTGEVEVIRFSSDKMLKLLHQVNFSSIDLAIHSPNRAMLLRSEDKGYVALLMPIWIQENA